MKSKAQGHPGALKESCLLLMEPTPMHSSAKSPGLPGESQDQRLTLIQRGFVDWSCYKHTQTRNPIQRSTNECAPCSFISRLPHCSVSQDGFLAAIHSRDPLFPERVTCAQACKAQLIDLLGFRGWGRWDIRCSLEISLWDHSVSAEGLFWEQQGRNSTVMGPTEIWTKVFF